MRVGIIFGGPSREREISFAGGRTVYDNLDKFLFNPVPIFVDSIGNFILLNWEHIYKGSIRDFYPVPKLFKPSTHGIQLYIEHLENLSDSDLNDHIAEIGKLIPPNKLSRYIDIAFLALHGPFGEDGQIQGLLESFGIPYTGSGILPSSIGINKAAQKKLLSQTEFKTPRFEVIDRSEWLNNTSTNKLYKWLRSHIKMPMVIKPATQGSSVGVSVHSKGGFKSFSKGMDWAFFVYRLRSSEWTKLSDKQKVILIKDLTDIKEGIGLPVRLHPKGFDVKSAKVITHPDKLFSSIEIHFRKSKETLIIEAKDEEPQVLVEQFINGREFSCIVIQGEKGEPIPLPPTEIIKRGDVFDYRSKYLPGRSSKQTPIDLPIKMVEAIRRECEQLFEFFQFNVYARIDGFITGSSKKWRIYLNDPNTTSGMLPSSFFFHQAAEIGLNPSQFLTYIIRTSLAERISTGVTLETSRKLLLELDKLIAQMRGKTTKKKQIAVLMGGYSTERHISVESGRNVYEKLSSSTKYRPIPIFLTNKKDIQKLADQNGSLIDSTQLFQIPINLLLKDNADDIRDKVLHFKSDPLIKRIRNQCAPITAKYAYKEQIFAPHKISYNELEQMVDGVFIALHGRPGEDGSIQALFDRQCIPYNGSGVDSSVITINKRSTNERLSSKGFVSLAQVVIHKNEWKTGRRKALKTIKHLLKYPLIAKPVDEGCSSAVKMINNLQQLEDYAKVAFRNQREIGASISKKIGLMAEEEFPMMEYILLEELAVQNGSERLIEVTGGLLTQYTSSGSVHYEIFEPSEAIANKEILTLEEKFLAGEGQNITPARFSKNPRENKQISTQVKRSFKNAVKALSIEGYARIDAFVRIKHHRHKAPNVKTIILEVNSLPGMTPATVIFHQAAIQGYKPFDYIDRILEYGFKKSKRLKGKQRGQK